MGEDERRLIDQRVSELRDEAEAKGWEFWITRESRNRVEYQTRIPIPGYLWHPFSVRLDGDQVVVRDLSPPPPQRVGCGLVLFNVVMLLAAMVVSFFTDLGHAYGITGTWTAGWVVVLGVWAGGNIIAFKIKRRWLD